MNSPTTMKFFAAALDQQLCPQAVQLTAPAREDAIKSVIHNSKGVN
jgi:hypothetical protein